MPIVLVGTHIDRMSDHEIKIKKKQMDRQYPSRKTWDMNTPKNQVQGHFAVGLTPFWQRGLSELKAELLEIAISHPRIGIGKVKVPLNFKTLQTEVERRKSSNSYLKWQEFVNLGTTLRMFTSYSRSCSFFFQILPPPPLPPQLTFPP